MKLNHGITIWTFLGSSIAELDKKLTNFENEFNCMLEDHYHDGLKASFEYIGSGVYNGYLYQRVRIKCNKKVTLDL